MNYQMNGYNLSGSFRLNIHEKASIQFLRRGMGMSMNAIAETMGRSTATIKKCLDHAHIQMDNRGKTQLQHINRILAFKSRKAQIQKAYWMFQNDSSIGFIDALRMVIKGFGRVPSQEDYAIGQNNGTPTRGNPDSGDGQEANENSGEGEEEEPA